MKSNSPVGCLRRNKVMYLEDGIGGGSSLREAERISSEIPIDLEKLGFLVAIEKCHREPTQKLEWLGLS